MHKLNLNLGNDIVDLSKPKNKLKHLELKFLRFIGRVFTQEEQTKILNSKDFNKPKILWALWAAKEAAYKALKKQLPELIFSHNQFMVDTSTLEQLDHLTEHNKITGKLLYNKNLIKIFINLEYNSNYIHCLAVVLNNNNYFNNFELINYNITQDLKNYLNLDYIKQNFTTRELSSVFSEQSLKTRYYAKKFLIAHNFDPNIEIVRINNSPPMLFVGEQHLTNHDLSLSHDGDFMAVCYI